MVTIRLTWQQTQQPAPSRSLDDAGPILRSLENGQLSASQALAKLEALDGSDGNPASRLEQQRRIEAALAELDGLVGLANVKRFVHELRAYVDIQQKRREAGLLCAPMALHMIFKGSPGTGKTTVARILAKILQAMNVLSKGHIVEVERADLVGEYIGHTAQKTRAQIKKALGGILFIDEAYSLARGGEKDFGREAIDTLVKAMEEHRDDLILILAGYRDEMDWFMRQNPGLRSRFPLHLTFADYTPAELFTIAECMFQQRQYRLDDAAAERLRHILNHAASHSDPERRLDNARAVRNFVESTIRRQAVRLFRSGQTATRESLMTVETSDLAWNA